MDTAQLLVALMGAGGGGAALVALITGIVKWWHGADERERDKNATLASQRRSAIEDREQCEDALDRSETRRRVAYEYASILRRRLSEAGINPGVWPLDHDRPLNIFDSYPAEEEPFVKPNTEISPVENPEEKAI